MRIAASLASLCFLAPLPLLALSPDEAGRPTPPPEPRPAERAAVREKPDTSGAVKAGQDQILLPKLIGLAVASNSEAALRLQQKSQPSVSVGGFSEREAAAIRKLAQPVLGKPVSLRSLDVLAGKLEGVFRSSGRPFMAVSFPVQEITSGIVAISIQPARAGQVLIAGNPAFGKVFAATAFRVRAGDEISGSEILDDLDWINQNSMRRASISYADGATPESLDLTLRLTAKKPWRIYGGIDNQLSENLGNERLFLGFQYGDVFALDHRLTAQVTSAMNPDDLKGISGIYEIPLPIRHLVGVSLGYTESSTDTPGPIDQSGTFSRFGLGYRVPLPRWHSIGQELRFGIEFRSNDYVFSNSSSQTVRFFNIETGWKAQLTDSWGLSRVDASLSYNPGRGTFGADDEDYIALGAAGAESLVARCELERTLKLPAEMTLVGKARGQWADSELLSSDQLSAGGYNRVRGFDETVGYSSTGIVLTLELQSKFYQPTRAAAIQALAFVDAAALHRDAATDVGQLAAVGVGFRWRFDDRVAARVDLGIPVDYPDDLDGDPQVEFAISTSW